MARLKHLYQIKSNHGVRRRPWKHVIHRALCFRRYLCYRRPLCPSSAAFDIIVRGWCPRLPRLYVYCCGDSQLHQAQLSSTPKRWSKCQCFLGTLFRTYDFWKPPCPGGSFIPNAVVWPPYWWGLPAGASTTLKLCILPLPLWDGFFSTERKNRERGKGRLGNGEPVSFGFELGDFDSKKMYCIHDTMVTKLQN